ncbi:hypothetical protein IEO21_00633 [Rhodonia placenta]|uniref:Uncharacterized protein n=1 Tax=Rhodonia placenta TaxID=104341 RepID=A0A8H7PB28_9APHY|nr:hypothetical protein IEO21_00633 [Postia placenta]
MSVVAPRAVWRVACFFFLLAHVALATLTNRTIDDENGDSVTGLQPVYAPPSGVWNYGPTCPGCFVQPDVDDCFDHSWHDVTANPSDPEPRNVTLTFNGTAIWVFGVIPNYVPYATTYVNISFELDGHTVGSFSHIPSESDAYQYNVTLYSNTSLKDAQHTLTMTPRRDVNASYMAFDWAMYTYDSDITVGTPSTTSRSATSPASSSATTRGTSSPTPTSHVAVGAIVGGVVGGVAALVIALLAIFCWRRRGRGRADRIRSMGPFAAHDDAIEPKSEAHSSDLSTSRPTLPTQYTLRSAATPSGRPLSTAAALSDAASSFAATNMSSIPATSSSGQLSSAALAAGASSARSPREVRGQSKAAMRREELTRQMRDIEAHVADLQRRQSHQSAPSSASLYIQSGTGIGSPPPVPVVEQYDDSNLRRQIETLQTEVERLRLEAVTHEEPPPAYEQPDEEEGLLAEHEEAGTSRAVRTVERSPFICYDSGIMNTIFTAYRYFVFVLFIVCNIVLCSVSAWNLSIALAVQFTTSIEVDAVAIAMGAVGLVFILPILFIDVLRKQSVTRHVWFECLWVGVFALLEFGMSCSA